MRFLKSSVLLSLFFFLFLSPVSAQTWGNPVCPFSVVGTVGSTGQYPSIAAVNGNPAIAYKDVTHNTVVFIRANDAAGTSWADPVLIDSLSKTGNIGSYVSLTTLHGFPAIAFYDATTNSLRFSIAKDINGNAWNESIIVASAMGTFCSLKEVNGNPAISFYDAANGDLKYVRAIDANGSSWAAPGSVATTGVTGQYSCMEIVNGFPAIAFYDVTNGDLKYTRALDANGTGWGTSLTLDASGNTGQYVSMKIINGNPAVAYYDVTNTNQKFIRASDINGSAWNAALTVDLSVNNVGMYSSLDVINGLPAIAYQDFTSGSLRLLKATDANGTAWAAPQTIDATGSTGLFACILTVNSTPLIACFKNAFPRASLRIWRGSDIGASSWLGPQDIYTSAPSGLYNSLKRVNGKPAFSFYTNNSSTLDLNYVRALDAEGQTWGNPVVIDATGAVGLYNSLNIVNGNPAICYYDATNTNLKYVRANDSDGNTWAAPMIIDGLTYDAGVTLSLEIINGRPAIAYHDYTNRDLKYIRANDANGDTWGAPVTVESAGDVGLFASLLDINGRPAIVYADPNFGRLKYVRANDADGTSWPAPYVVDAGPYSGSYHSFAVINGNPAIAYYYNNTFDLRYVRANDADGTSWPANTTIDAANFVGSFNSMAVLDGKPAITYYDETAAKLKLITATDANGSAWNAAIVLHAIGNVGTYTSLCKFNDQETGLVFYDSENSVSLYMHYKNLSAVALQNIYLQSTAVADDVQLNFQVTGGDDLKNLELQRSSNGWQFTTIGMVIPVSNPGTQHYQYTDRNISSGANSGRVYYKIKATENSSRVRFSNITSVKMKAGAANSIYPNPVTDICTVKIAADENSNGMLQVVDNNGKKIHSFSISGPVQKLNLHFLAPGFYNLVFPSGKSIPFVKN